MLKLNWLYGEKRHVWLTFKVKRDISDNHFASGVNQFGDYFEVRVRVKFIFAAHTFKLKCLLGAATIFQKCSQIIAQVIYPRGKMVIWYTSFYLNYFSRLESCFSNKLIYLFCLILVRYKMTSPAAIYEKNLLAD